MVKSEYVDYLSAFCRGVLMCSGQKRISGVHFHCSPFYCFHDVVCVSSFVVVFVVGFGGYVCVCVCVCVRVRVCVQSSPAGKY